MPTTDRDIRELRGHIPQKLGQILIEMNGDIHAIRQAIGTLAQATGELAAALNLHNAKLANLAQTKANNHAERLQQMAMEVSSDPTITGEIHEDK
jgi:ABC-type transporter Mla subunit MlaD